MKKYLILIVMVIFIIPIILFGILKCVKEIEDYLLYKKIKKSFETKIISW